MNIVAPSPEVPRFEDAYDIDTIPVSSNKKPWTFAVSFVFLVIGVLVRKISHKSKKLHRAPSRDATASTAVDDNNKKQSLLDEDEEHLKNLIIRRTTITNMTKGKDRKKMVRREC